MFMNRPAQFANVVPRDRRVEAFIIDTTETQIVDVLVRVKVARGRQLGAQRTLARL